MKKKSISAGILGFLGLIIVSIGASAQESFSSILQSIFTPFLNLFKDYLISPPETNITEVYDSKNNSLLSDKTTISPEITFRFEGISNFGISHFECSIDSMDEKSFSKCPNPKTIDITIDNLAMDKEHIFYVLSVDKLGNRDQSPSSFEFIVERSPPETNLLKVVAGNKIITDKRAPSTSSISFYFNGTDNEGISKYICTFENEITDDCNSPKNYNPNPGTYTFEVKAVDNNGIEDPNPPNYVIDVFLSGAVSGTLIRLNEPTPNLEVVIDNKYRDNSDLEGTFIVPHVPRGQNHSFIVNDNEQMIYGPRTIFTKSEDEIKELKEIVLDSEEITESNQYTKLNKNPYFIPEIKELIKPIDLEYIQSSDYINGRWNVTVYINGPMEVISKIEKVVYYLHPTFNNPTIPQYDKNNRFDLDLNVYGYFKIYAKAFFKEGIVDLSRFILLSEKREE